MHYATARIVRAAITLQYVVTTANVIFREVFKLWWFNKLYVEIDLMWF